MSALLALRQELELAALTHRLRALKRRSLHALREAAARHRWRTAAAHAVAVAAGRQRQQANLAAWALHGLCIWAASGRQARQAHGRRLLASLRQAVREAVNAAACAEVWRARRRLRGALLAWKTIAAAEVSAARGKNLCNAPSADSS